MDFDLSKENVQPLRGGRDVSQLGVALQAQTDMEHQKELLQQRGEFEKLIRTYTGDDPLENWYNYISWVEQSYPKQGHEGNLISLLEYCLKLFENDKRYSNDRRLCKLFIKYIDFQQNPLELYHMMYAQKLCRGCADLYKAWAYYHEAASDFQNAHKVFECGKRELAQPYEELQNAHQNLIMAAGQHIIYGPNERSLSEKRQALTSLCTYKSGQVGSIRSSSGNAGILGTSITSRANAAVPIYEDTGEEGIGIEAGPNSIVTAARRQEVPKENTIKPGPWTTVPVKKRHAVKKLTPSFTVHEDSEDDDNAKMKNFVSTTSENYSDWIVSLTIPEPKDDRMIPMYPKAKVYSDVSTEYSLEELRAARIRFKKNRLQVASAETNQAVQSILGNVDLPNMDKNKLEETDPFGNFKQQSLSFGNIRDVTTSDDKHLFNKQEDKQHSSPFNTWGNHFQQHGNQRQTPNLFNSETWSSSEDAVNNVFSKYSSNKFTNYEQSKTLSEEHVNEQQIANQDMRYQQNCQNSWNQTIPKQNSESSVQHQNTNVFNFDIWNSPEVSVNAFSKKPVSKFAIYEQSNLALQEQIEPKGSAMKTPFKDLNAEELAETGSRGGMDVAAAAPVDSAKRLPVFDDDSSSSFDKMSDPISYGDLSCNTQMFVFNLNAMKVSTPQNKQDVAISCDGDSSKNARKQLFSDNSKPYGDKGDNKVLSTIFEETKSYGQSSCSSSSGATTKSSLFNNHTKQSNMATISEEHNSYLAQNLMVNAALRSSSLGDLMDLGHHSPAIAIASQQMSVENMNTQVSTIPTPTVVSPLGFVPSDPFKQSLIDKLLQKVCFPGPHTNGYYCINSIPNKLFARKETMSIGSDKYVIEKQLGKGTYGTVFRGVDLRTGNTVALKYQKPANRWEFYICRELQSRLAHSPLRERFMDVRIGYFSDQASILISEFMPCGSLLDVANMVKQKSGRAMKESLCIHFCLEMLKVVQAMHQVKIIHADIKPDNFLIKLFPNDIVGLHLIDFGCSIDMTLFPNGASFTRKVTTEDFICCEMIDGRPWNYHTDLFCVAATAHVLLFEKYIQLQKRDGHWSISNRLPRYARLDLWNMFFSTLLNQQSGPADSASLQAMLEDSLNHKFDDYHNDLRYLINILKNR